MVRLICLLFFQPIILFGNHNLKVEKKKKQGMKILMSKHGKKLNRKQNNREEKTLRVSGIRLQLYMILHVGCVYGIE